jgi:hypothetical protein
MEMAALAATKVKEDVAAATAELAATLACLVDAVLVAVRATMRLGGLVVGGGEGGEPKGAGVSDKRGGDGLRGRVLCSLAWMMAS